MALVAIVSAALLASSCGVETHKVKVDVASGGTLRLAVVPKSVGLDYWEKVRRGAECAASKLDNVQITWNGVSDETNVAGQVDLLDNYIGQGVNGLVYAATDSTALVDITERASSAGIKVINIDSGTDPQPKGVPLLATNNTKGALLAADALAKAVGSKGGKVAIVAFHAGSQTNDQRVDGFKKGLKKHKNLKLVETQYSENDYNQALTVTQNILTAHPDLKGIFAANEASDVGAVEAVRMSKKLGQVKIVGWDTSPDELEGVTVRRRLRARDAGPVPDGQGRRRDGGEGDPAAPEAEERGHRRGARHAQEPQAAARAADGRADLRAVT